MPSGRRDTSQHTHLYLTYNCDPSTVLKTLMQSAASLGSRSMGSALSFIAHSRRNVSGSRQVADGGTLGQVVPFEPGGNVSAIVILPCSEDTLTGKAREGDGFVERPLLETGMSRCVLSCQEHAQLTTSVVRLPKGGSAPNTQWLTTVQWGCRAARIAQSLLRQARRSPRGRPWWRRSCREQGSRKTN